MLLPRFSAQEKREGYRAMETGTRRASKSVDRRESSYPTGLHTRGAIKNHREK